jgi:uncharacterized membrane protein YgdD (TMEM256/DUF423 family)
MKPPAQAHCHVAGMTLRLQPRPKHRKMHPLRPRESTTRKGEGMPRTARLFLVLGCIAALLAVALGAFGAHGLKARITPELLLVYKTGVEYHFYHAFGLILVGLAAWRLPESGYLAAAGWAMFAGMLLFSGSLYLLALTGLAWLGAITPVGGAAFLAAWGLFTVAIVKAP